jgi:hypothetical protein
MFDQTQIGRLLHEEHLHTIDTLQRLEDTLSGQTSKSPPDPAEVQEMGLLAAIAMLVEPEDDARLADLYRTLT